MLNILLCGCGGRMGAALSAAAVAAGDRIVAGVDIHPTGAASYPVYTSADEFEGKADVIVDFSHHSALSSLLAYAERTATPLVVCTTGHTEEELTEMREAALRVPVFFSRNMSLGINLLMALCRRAAATLGADFDVEIIEKHHNKKLDAPSGTALMLADCIKEADTDTPHPYVYERHSERRARERGEIGISAVRGGTIVGEHDVLFCGKDEVITLSHSATSREVFATGALRAAHFMVGRAPGLYNMDNVVNDL
ncbi:MAG: 4-hydroxy-tetrahydrodipicolinate reductase [Ruminococcaceae bacterium]|nr:4-hydroxy-tetrahydrodipicolinate reductase [Oscillospiraceae bacterium]